MGHSDQIKEKLLSTGLNVFKNETGSETEKCQEKDTPNNFSEAKATRLTPVALGFVCGARPEQHPGVY